MSASVTSFAIRYRAENRRGVLYPKTHLDRDQTRAEIGRIIDRAHELGRKLDYIIVVPCVKRPGSRVIAEISRDAMTQEELVKACNAYHKFAVAAAGSSC